VRSEAPEFETRPFLKIRRAYLDILAAGRRKNMIHGLVEVDVTDARRLLHDREAAGEDLSFTAFVIHAVEEAGRRDPDTVIASATHPRNRNTKTTSVTGH